jgi:hypothetical protein
VPVSLVEVREMGAAPGAEPIMWRLLTTHPVNDAAMAWQVVAWYRQRWIIEQFFRTLKQQGLQLEDSQLETADRLIKLTAIAARAACTIMQWYKLATAPPAKPQALPLTRRNRDAARPAAGTRRKNRPAKKPASAKFPGLGRHGSSQNSAAGKVTQNPNHPAQ